jgi:hypothetical protein
MEALVPIPDRGLVFAGGRRIRLADIDARGRLRLDAVARFQDVAIDDVEETGWGAPEHLWFLRSVRVDVLAPFLRDRQVDTTSGDATVERTQEFAGLMARKRGHESRQRPYVSGDRGRRPVTLQGRRGLSLRLS